MRRRWADEGTKSADKTVSQNAARDSSCMVDLTSNAARQRSSSRRTSAKSSLNDSICAGTAREERKDPGGGGLFEETCSMAPDGGGVGRTSGVVKSEHQEDA